MILSPQIQSRPLLAQGAYPWVRMGFFACFFFLRLSWNTPLFADDDNHGVLAAGVVHNIAPDRKVERIGGVMQPEPLDLYLKRLFDQLFQKIDSLESRLQSIESKIDVRVSPQSPQSSEHKT